VVSVLVGILEKRQLTDIGFLIGLSLGLDLIGLILYQSIASQKWGKI
jgi:hypothetical protein